MKNKDLVLCSLFAALTGILAQISLPFPGGVSLTLQTFAVSLCAILLGSKKAFISLVVYICIGVIGIPVFSDFKGGFQAILGPTGGFILSFPVMAFIIGYICEKTRNKMYMFLSIILGSFVNYMFGIIQFMLVTNLSFEEALLSCFVPFIFTDLTKIILATLLGYKLKYNKSIQNVIV